MKRLNKKNITFIFATFVTVVGVYNALVINSHSEVAEGHFYKRADEMTGKFTAGRNTASVVWKKLGPAPVQAQAQKPAAFAASVAADSSVQDEKEAAIKDDLKLSLVEVVNPNKYKNGLPQTAFTGNVTVTNGVIDSLNVNLPGVDTLEVSFSELNGNVFSYEYSGSTFSGMMYQVDQMTYMVTLTNGPLEGTRLRFAGELSQEQQQTEQALAQNHNVAVGSFGNTSELHDAVEGLDTPVQKNIQAQGFNMDAQVIQ